MRKSSGFTLIELMVVLVVIGVLVSIAIPNYARSVERTRCSFALNMLKSMRNAAVLYFRENQTFTGITLPAMETIIGATFYSGNTHPDWQFSVVSISDNEFRVEADRIRGPHIGDDIVLTSGGDFTTSSYPYENPGDF